MYQFAKNGFPAFFVNGKQSGFSKILFLCLLFFLHFASYNSAFGAFGVSCVAGQYPQCGACGNPSTTVSVVTRTCNGTVASYSCGQNVQNSSQCGQHAPISQTSASGNGTSNATAHSTNNLNNMSGGGHLCPNGHQVGDTYNQCGGTCNGVTANSQQLMHVTITSSCGYMCTSPAYVDGQCGFNQTNVNNLISAPCKQHSYNECTNGNSYCATNGGPSGSGFGTSRAVNVTQMADCSFTCNYLVGNGACGAQSSTATTQSSTGTTSSVNLAKATCVYSQSGPNGIPQCFKGTGSTTFNVNCHYDSSVGVIQVSCQNTNQIINIGSTVSVNTSGGNNNPIINISSQKAASSPTIQCTGKGNQFTFTSGPNKGSTSNCASYQDCVTGTCIDRSDTTSNPSTPFADCGSGYSCTRPSLCGGVSTPNANFCSSIGGVANVCCPNNSKLSLIPAIVNAVSAALPGGQAFLASKVLGASVIAASDSVNYDPTTNTFSNPNFNIQNLMPGQYQLILHVDGYLDKLLTNSAGNVFTVIQGQKTLAVGPVSLTGGDILKTNTIDIQDYNFVLGCLGLKDTAQPTTTCPDPKAADINLDGTVTQGDLNTVKANIGQQGDVFTASSTTPETLNGTPVGITTNPVIVTPTPSITPVFQCLPDPSCLANKKLLQLCPLKCTQK